MNIKLQSAEEESGDEGGVQLFSEKNRLIWAMRDVCFMTSCWYVEICYKTYFLSHIWINLRCLLCPYVLLFPSLPIVFLLYSIRLVIKQMWCIFLCFTILLNLISDTAVKRSSVICTKFWILLSAGLNCQENSKYTASVIVSEGGCVFQVSQLCYSSTRSAYLGCV